MQKEIRKRAYVYAVLAVTSAVLLGALCYNLAIYPPIARVSGASPISWLKTFSSYDELKDFLQTKSQTQGIVYIYGPWDVALGRMQTLVSQANARMLVTPPPQAFTFSAAVSSVTQEDLSGSTTNVQVAGVDEADIVKRDGQYLYVLSDKTVYVVRVYPPDQAEVLSKLTFADWTPMGIFASDDRLVVLGCKYDSVSVGISNGLSMPYGYVESRTPIEIYDVSDRSNPLLLKDLTMSGSYFDSRMIGNYVYAVVGQGAFATNGTVVLPTIQTYYGTKQVSPTEIHYSNFSDEYFQYTTVIALNVVNTTETPTYTTLLLGQTSDMYVSLSNMYITYPDSQGNTTIYRLSIAENNVTCEAYGTVPGNILNQFSMDEYNGYFRVATTTGIYSTQRNNVYVLDMTMKTVGALENLAQGENLHSTRFVGDRCYLVTFIKTDPLFVIDLSNPAAPKVLGELSIPGYSDYLHPYDETHLIGVGKETVASEEGYFAWYQGIKISLFDVSNVSSPVQIANVTIGDRGSDTPVLTDHKAFLFDKSKNLLAIPVTVAKIDPSQYPPSQYPSGIPSYAYGTPVWQGAIVFNITLTEGLVQRGNVTQLQGLPSWGDPYEIKRIVYIENTLYTISDKLVKMNRLDNLMSLGEVPLS
jgi:inhibitor of cysteine peptidase